MSIEGFFWADASADHIAKLDNDLNETVLVSGLTSPVQIDIATSGEKIYWADYRLIQRSDLDGSNVETLLDTTNIPTPSSYPFYLGIVVDEKNGKFYCSDTYNDRILIANIDGTSAQAIWSGVNGGGFGGQRYMAIDPVNEWVYWGVGRGVGGNDYSIHRIDYDGGNHKIEISGSSFNNFNAIYLDVDNQIMYWSNRTLGIIESSGISGTVVNTVVSGLANPGGLTVDNDDDKVYWSDQTENAIFRASLDGTDIETVVSGTLSPNGVWGSLPVGPERPPKYDWISNRRWRKWRLLPYARTVFGRLRATTSQTGIVVTDIENLFFKNCPRDMQIVGIRGIMGNITGTDFDGPNGKVDVLFEISQDIDTPPGPPVTPVWNTLMETVDCRSIANNHICFDAPSDGVNIIQLDYDIIPQGGSLRAKLNIRVDDAYAGSRSTVTIWVAVDLMDVEIRRIS